MYPEYEHQMPNIAKGHDCKKEKIKSETLKMCGKGEMK
ncbi:hypothetical protein CHCC14820_3651 [Bacillus paralicheniformis]|uniref:Uncharacterized protein n=1 Tax=Bacillus paralicheniformis TaxID=1648923 RepID=A0ABY3FVL2_9BACI|nr:hypothetical protein CHCC20331_0837 [Bacillus paralicheniformis]TWK91901.1 hypothetical protein CHCC20333_1491 [Bacillus paralicheniformis]TWL38596.1 hypothetical protein CHCC15381_0714 [Bacillus paralicheniformis]TWM37753.1 hypothetical protein CHCC14820_3651 [Bacillus paralicheniformis]